MCDGGHTTGPPGVGRVSCSALSRAAGLPLAGTASRADRWIVLEHRAPWGRDAVEDSGLPTRLVEALQAFDGRMLLVRRPGRPQGPPVAFLARTTEEGGELGTIPLDQV